MTAYLVKLDPASSDSVVLENGHNGIVVEAADAAEAKEMAESAFNADAADWANAIVTAIVVDADFEDWTFRIRISPPTGAPLYDVSVVGTAADDLDEIGALFETAFDALGLDSTYTEATQVMELAAIGDAIGDHTVEMFVIPPGGYLPGITTMEASKVHEGIAAAVLSVTFVADAPAIPFITGKVRAE